jgi:hypothetical protein
MSHRPGKDRQGRRPAPRPSTARIAALAMLLGSALAPFTLAAPGASLERSVTGTGAQRAGSPMPVFKLVEGARGSPDPYTPRVLDIPAGREVALDVTDNIGGCALVTVFPGLAVHGGALRVRVPVGETRRVVLRAPKPGRYVYHCAGNMYFGEIIAR